MQRFLVVVLALAAVSFGDEIYTYTPSDPDIGDLNHDYAYSWGINGSQLVGKEITGAVLEINDLYNWKANEWNALWIDLLDVAPVGITSKWDGGATSNQDYFAYGRELDRLNYNYDPSNHDGKHDGLYSSRTQGISIVKDGYAWLDGGILGPKFDVAITFTGAELTALTNAIGSNGNFGFGIDPDCHFYNSGFKFTVTPRTTNVPEPASLSLFGLGLLGLFFFRRKKQ